MSILFAVTQRIMPGWVHKRLIGDWGQEGFVKYLKNTGWIFVAHVVTFLTSFLTVAVVARYLGPENLGKLNYAQSFVALFSIFASLGIDQVIYRELITHPEHEKDILGTAAFIKLTAGSLSFCTAVGASFFIESDPLLMMLVSISALTFLINPLGVLAVFFNANVQAKYNSHITLFTALFIPAVKLLIIYLDRGVIYFAATLVLEATISVAYLTYIYVVRAHGNPLLWHMSARVSRKLLHDSWPLLLAGISAQIYSRIDQVMIQHLIDSTAVGLYSAATRLTQITQAFPGLVIAALLPALLNAHKHDRVAYIARLRSLSAFMAGMSLCIIIPIAIFAPLVVQIVFGGAFVAAVPVLRLHIWATVGIIFVMLLQNYLVAENLGRIFFIVTFIGAATNTLLNFMLIPTEGILGAAMTTLISYVVMFCSLLFFKKTRFGLRELLYKNRNEHVA